MELVWVSCASYLWTYPSHVHAFRNAYQVRKSNAAVKPYVDWLMQAQRWDKGHTTLTAQFHPCQCSRCHEQSREKTSTTACVVSEEEYFSEETQTPSTSILSQTED